MCYLLSYELVFLDYGVLKVLYQVAACKQIFIKKLHTNTIAITSTSLFKSKSHVGSYANQHLK